MKLITLLAMCEKYLCILDKYGVNITDYKYIQLYYDFETMRAKEKYEFAINCLAKKYSISISTAKRLLRKFNQEIK